MRRGGFGAGALLSVALGAMLSGAVNATDLSSMPVVSGTLTISAPGEYVVDGDVQCTTLAITAEGAVTFVNPSAGETNTIHVGSVTSVANASAAFDCKVAFDAAYNVVAEGPVTFAGGATATAPGTTSGAYGNVLSGDISFTSAWVLPASAAYTVPAGSRVTGVDVSGGNGSSILVEEGGVAKFASATLAIQGLRITVHGELDVEGWCECNATGTNVVEPVFPSDVFSTGTIRVGGFKRTGNKVVCGFNAGDIYVGGNGLYSESTSSPMFFWIYKSEPVFHAAADFSIRGYNANCGVCLYDMEAVTFNTHGHTVSWTAKIGSNGREKLVKDGDGVFIMQPVAVNSEVSRLMPIEVKGGTFRQGNDQITGPITVRSGATLAVADGVTIANAITLEAGATLEFGSGAVVGGAVTWPEGDIYICAKETGILIPSGVTDEVLARMSLSPASVGGTLEVVDGALVFTSDNHAVYTWKGGVDGRYSTAGNWLLDGATAISAPGAQDVALFTPSSNVVVVLDGDAAIAELRVFGSDSVTFVNPSAGETNTIHVGSVTSVANASAAFDCKVAFDAAYNVAAEGPVTFAGGATATAPGTTSGAYGNVLSGDISFTSAWVLPASAAYTVPSGSRVTGVDVSGGNGSSILVEEGGVAKFASATLAIQGLRITVHGELDVEGWCECNATGDNVIAPVFPSDVFSTGTIRVGGFKRTGNKVVCGFNAGDIYVGGNGLYSESTSSPMFFWIYKSEPVFHAAADFSIRGYNANCGVCLYDMEAVTFNTHGHTVSWTAKIWSNGREKLVKDGDGVFIMQPVAVNSEEGSRLMPIEVKGGTFRQGNGQIAGPIAVRGGATLEVASGVTAANAVTLDAGASLALGAGGSVAGSISTPATGTATVKPHGDFSGLTGWKASATLGVLAADADVSALSLDATGIVLPRGWQAKLMRSNDNLDIVFSKSGMMVIVK